MELKRGPVPLHYQLREILRNRIVRGEYAPGDQFPTEKELRTEYGVSQTTVRRAISELAHDGLLESLPGKGTFVRRSGSELDLGPLTSFSQEMRRRGLKPASQLVRAQVGSAPLHAVEALQVAAGHAGLFCLERVRLGDSLALMLETAYVSPERFPGIETMDWEDSRSLIQLMLEQYHTPLIEVREVVEPVLIPEQPAALLGVEPFSLALHLSSTLFTHHSQPIQYTDALIPRQRAHYQVRFEGGHAAGSEPATHVGRSLAVVGGT